MLAKLNVPANSEVGPMAAMKGAARGGSPAFHVSHTRAGMATYKKASPRTTVEVADGNILLVEGFGTTKVDLDETSNTTKLVWMGTVAYVSGLSRNCCPPSKQWSNRENH